MHMIKNYFIKKGLWHFVHAVIIFCPLQYSGLFANQSEQTNISEEYLIGLISEGIDAIYDLHSAQYKKELIYESNRHGYTYEKIIAFTGLFLNKLSKLGSEIPLEKRRFYWECTYVLLTEKIMLFIDESNIGKIDLNIFKPKIEEYIKKECRVNGVFG